MEEPLGGRPFDCMRHMQAVSGHCRRTAMATERARSDLSRCCHANCQSRRRRPGASSLPPRAQVDKVNRQVAARMTGSSAFTSFRKFDARRQGLMRAQLQRILAAEGLSENVYEIVSSSLQD
jgi:hypothetical protein